MSSDVAGPQARDGCQGREVPIPMEHFQIVAKGAGGDQTVDRGPYRQPCASCEPVQVHRIAEHPGAQRGFDDGESIHAVTRASVSILVAESLENLLDHRQTCDHVVEPNQRFNVHGSHLPEDLDPDRRVDQRQRRAPRARRPESRRIAGRSPVQRPEPARVRIWCALRR